MTIEVGDVTIAWARNGEVGNIKKYSLYPRKKKSLHVEEGTWEGGVHFWWCRPLLTFHQYLEKAMRTKPTSLLYNFPHVQYDIVFILRTLQAVHLNCLHFQFASQQAHFYLCYMILY